ncbi:hypothetical protein [Hyalangium gracile]|uniref:hypothetical protein n=1 Tax=Hyalangium gracile TaxID=394092 RepID=UPI001CCEAA4B|nr:hypothetical protein [Hyalangium gracile]
MKQSKMISGPVPEHIKTRTREEFLAQTNFGALSGDDLYWLLYRAASEAQGSLDKFLNEVEQLLTAKLGEGNFIFVVRAGASISSDGGYGGSALPNSQYWAGYAGVLPGFGANHAIACSVFWR